MPNVKHTFQIALGQQLSAQGYVMKKKGTYIKKVTDGFRFQLNVIFFGSEKIQFSPVFGVLLDDIEHCLRSPALHSLFPPKYFVNMPTIFKGLEQFTPSPSPNSSYPKDISVDPMTDCVDLAKSIAAAESRIYDIDALTTFIEEDYGFPIGHHAYRIPLFLFSIGNTDSASKFIEYISRTGFIADYADNLERVKNYCIS